MASQLFHHLITAFGKDGKPSNISPPKPLGSPIDVAYEAHLFPNGPTGLPDEQAVRLHVRQAVERRRELIFNIESWNNAHPFGSAAYDQRFQECQDWLTQTAEWARDESKFVRFGFSCPSAPPGITLGQNIRIPWSANQAVADFIYPTWRSQFDRRGDELVPARWLELVDFIAPMAYAENHAINSNVPESMTDAEWWSMITLAHVRTWRTLGKSIYLMLSPYWRGSLEHGEISYELAKAQTAFARKHSLHRVWWGRRDEYEWPTTSPDWYRGAAR